MLGIAIKSYSKNYYVKSTGNDNNTGLSDAQAWLTIDKVNSSSFLAGDTIFFNKGDTWRETLTIPSSGNSTAYIVFTSYGTGLAPKILGSTDVTAWTKEAGNIWYSNNEVTDPYLLPYYGNIYFKETDGDITWGRVEKEAKVNLAVEYDWIWITNHIYIYSPTDPNTRYSGVEISQRSQSVDLDKHEYVTFDGLELAYSGRYGITCGEYPYSELSGLMVKNCNIHHFGSKLGAGGYALSIWYSDVLIKGNVIHDASRRLTSLNLNNQVIHPHNIIIEGNSFYDGFHESGVGINTNAAGTWDNVIIRNNLFYQNTNAVDAVENPISQALFVAVQGTLTGSTTNIHIYNNIFKNTNYYFAIFEHANSVYLYNNTFCGFNTTIKAQNMAYINIIGAGNTSIKNNIFYNNITWAMVPYTRNISVAPTAGTVTMDNNLYYNIDPVQSLITWRGVNYTQSQWATYKSKTGQDAHSPTPSDPLFDSSSDYHLRAGSHAIGTGVNVGLKTDYDGSAFKNPPSIGAYEYDSKPTSPVIPVYQSSFVENTTPSLIEMTYNLNLANIVPAISAFTIMVNSVDRSVSSVAISGAKVLLTLASAVVYGDVVTVVYNKPAINPIKTTSGGEAASLSAQAVTNRVLPVIPTYVSSAIENATPSVIEITFNLSLTNIVPAASAFLVNVNSVARIVNSVAISGPKILLTLASQVVYGDVVNFAYTKPATNPLQTSSGGQAATLSAQTVDNRVNAVSTQPDVVNIPPVAVVDYSLSSYSGFVSEINASGSYDPDRDNLTFSWSVPSNVSVSATNSSKIQFLSPIVSESQTVEFTLKISDGKTIESRVLPVEILPYQPELEVAEISNIEASGFQLPYYPYNILDGNIGTMWSANGDNQWLIMELKELFNIQHVKIAFQPGQKRESYFDILGSDDRLIWEPILIKSASCGFSGDLQVFDFPLSKTGKEFRFVKFVGHSNSADSWNYISEFKIFGYKHRNPTSYDNQPVKLYPNPAHNLVNIRIDDSTLKPDFIRIINLAGKIVFKDKVNPDIKELQVQLDLIQGAYIVQMGSGDLTLFTQKLVVIN